ncbi:hypothetical protein QJS10_CPB19g01317 [Acorus calamus]|uniref:TatD related DNase n=1 Tax=Acorus calamus TaxID=4465 RepID=A0AAV9CEK3_ACOCL|nr:hypothetical protein QJS10_CPB19g01317 [Acorus calamus]
MATVRMIGKSLLLSSYSRFPFFDALHSFILLCVYTAKTTTTTKSVAELQISPSTSPVTGGSLEESKEALAIAETDGRLFCTVGVHPTRCKEFEENGNPRSISRRWCHWRRRGSIRERYFEKQFELAEAVKLPMFLHMRAAAEDFSDILARNKHRFNGGVAHSFTGSMEDLDKLLSFDNLFLGINGCSLKTADNLHVLSSIPVERMMIETDSPYCEIKNTHAGVKFVKSVWPSKKKEKYDPDSTVKGRNEPCLVRQVLEVVAGCKGVSDLGPLSRTLYHNTCRLIETPISATSLKDYIPPD